MQHVNSFDRTWDALKPRELIEEARQEHPPIVRETTEDYVVVLGRNTAVESGRGRKLDLPEVFVFKVQDDKVIKSWMFHQDTVAILDFLKGAQQQDINAINVIASRAGRPSLFYICRPGRSNILDLASRK